MKSQFVYVYVDDDHNEVEVFSTLKQAKAHAQKEWPDVDTGWEKGSSGWGWGEYVSVLKRKVQS